MDIKKARNQKHALYMRSLSLEWDMGAIRKFYALVMGLRAFTMVRG
jgi:hypothetical protein